MFGKKQKKTKIYPRHHWEIVWGSLPERHQAMNDLVSHCVADVEMNETIFWYVLHSDWNPIFKRVR